MKRKKYIYTVIFIFVINSTFFSKNIFGYNRLKAVSYADEWCNDGPQAKGYNPEYFQYPNDCTNFVSQCLKAGGIFFEGKSVPGYLWEQGNVLLRIGIDGKGCITQPKDMRNSLPTYHGATEWDYYPPEQFKIGDVIVFKNETGYVHSVVSSVREGTYIAVNAHTNDRYHEPISTYLDTYPEAYYLHIPDSPIVIKVSLTQDGEEKYLAYHNYTTNKLIVTKKDPLAPGEVRVKIIFDTSMDTSAGMLSVNYGKISPYLNFNVEEDTGWSNNITWNGKFTILEGAEGGKFHLSIVARAEDGSMLDKDLVQI